MAQIENRMVVDSEWEEIEFLQMRRPDRQSKRLKKVMDGMEFGGKNREKEGGFLDEFV